MDRKLYREVNNTLGGFTIEQVVTVIFTLLIEKGVVTKQEFEEIFNKEPITQSQQEKKKWYQW